MSERPDISMAAGPTRVGLLGVSALIAVAVAVSASLGVIFQGVLDAQGSGEWASVRRVAQAIVQRADRLQRRQAERPAPDSKASRCSAARLGGVESRTARDACRHVGLDALTLAAIDLPPPVRA